MSKPKRNSTTLSKPSGFGALKSTAIIKADTTEPKIVKQEIKLPQDITFGHAMQGIQMSIANELINESTEKFVKYTLELQELAIKISEKNHTTSSSHQIVEYIEALIIIKSKVMAILSWGGTIANLANHLVSSLDVQAPNELLNSVAQALEGLITMFDSVVSSIPNISILGITLFPDQRRRCRYRYEIYKP
ncbi:hypothetical protein Syn7502_02335 [Synechococcus sp. PCC 7502]|uniref:hypothetical protein n=1 Tax=Synechococcus sp. PCC 7502 TaxID=1173263 RepID=UPI00029FA5BB|nr:hypothetical protein [Synechococcus sp. PCC 7502]AFY74334.1 hypothetical protein Syn7502_02335 [Synechococcus sp. PCC 7502]